MLKNFCVTAYAFGENKNPICAQTCHTTAKGGHEMQGIIKKSQWNLRLKLMLTYSIN